MVFREKFLFKYDRRIVKFGKFVVDGIEKFSHPLAAYCGNGIDWDALRFKFSADCRHGIVFPVNHVDLVGGDDLGAVRKCLIIGRKLLIDGIDVCHRIPAFRRRSIYNVDNQLRPFNMAQKFMTKTDSVGSAFNQTRDIRNDKSFGIFQIYNAKIGI